MGELFSNFMRDYDEAESFSTAQELKDYWEKDENFERLKKSRLWKTKHALYLQNRFKL